MLKDLPPRLIFADTETTGLHSADRIVSIGLVDLNVAELQRGRIDAACSHLVFDPGKKSHPRAEAVHGYSDWTLRHQDVFADHVGALRPLFDDTSIIWAHNAEFDQRFFKREFDLAGRPIAGDLKCTMGLFRDRYPGERASLTAALNRFGVSRTSSTHGALEDAWLAMVLFLSIHGVQLPRTMPPATTQPPSNYREPPPLVGPLPRRTRRKTAAEAIPPPPAPSMDAVLAASRATATLMLFVAMADGEIAEAEWAAILHLIDETSERLGHRLSVDQRHDLVASLIDPDAQFSIRSAASELVLDERASQGLARWIREVAYADGSGSDAEAQAISTIMNTIRAVRAA